MAKRRSGGGANSAEKKVKKEEQVDPEFTAVVQILRGWMWFVSKNISCYIRFNWINLQYMS